MKTTFRVSRNYPKILRNRKRRIQRRLARRNWEDQAGPMTRASNIHYELSDKTRATGYGGIGAVHLMVQRLGLVEQIDQNIELLKVHLPYHESDHVLNIAYSRSYGQATHPTNRITRFQTPNSELLTCGAISLSLFACFRTSRRGIARRRCRARSAP